VQQRRKGLQARSVVMLDGMLLRLCWRSDSTSLRRAAIALLFGSTTEAKGKVARVYSSVEKNRVYTRGAEEFRRAMHLLCGTLNHSAAAC